MKAENKQRLRDRARRALEDLYHNATIPYSWDLCGRTEDTARAWFESAAEFEIEYLRDGGAYGVDYRETLAAPCNAGKLKNEAARRYYVAAGLRAQRAEQDDCGAITGWRLLELAAGNSALARKLQKTYGKLTGLKRNNSLWERIGDYGRLYQYGRGGRTLAPDGLMSLRGDVNTEYAGELSAAACVDLIRIVESFNAYVVAWCRGVPELWREHCAEEDAEIKAAKAKAAARKAKETRERKHWEARGVMTAAPGY